MEPSAAGRCRGGLLSADGGAGGLSAQRAACRADDRAGADRYDLRPAQRRADLAGLCVGGHSAAEPRCRVGAELFADLHRHTGDPAAGAPAVPAVACGPAAPVGPDGVGKPVRFAGGAAGYAARYGTQLRLPTGVQPADQPAGPSAGLPDAAVRAADAALPGGGAGGHSLCCRPVFRRGHCRRSRRCGEAARRRAALRGALAAGPGTGLCRSAAGGAVPPGRPNAAAAAAGRVRRPCGAGGRPAAGTGDCYPGGGRRDRQRTGAEGGGSPAAGGHRRRL